MIISRLVGDCNRVQGVKDSRVHMKEDARIQTLEPLNPRILEPFLPTNWEKNLNIL